MARLQILELPEGSSDDRPPFILVIDQVATGPDGELLLKSSDFEGVNERIGARAVLVFEETVDIPANDVTAYSGEAVPKNGDPDEMRRLALCDALLISLGSTWDQIIEQTAERQRTVADLYRHTDGQRLADERTDIARDMDRLAKWRDELADALGIDRGSSWDDVRNTAAEFRAELIRSENAREHLRQDRDEARTWARHGYEIGQKHCGWTDHGVAPSWLTEGWRNSFDSCEHLKQAAELDEALARVRAVSTEPEVMNAQQEHPSTWKHGYHCGVLAAKGAAQPRNEPTVKPPNA
jgi:hypothetical protein